MPRQKIYEVLDSLVEKGFASVVQEKTKLFSAVEPALALRGYLNRREETYKHELEEQSRNALSLAEDLANSYAPAQGSRGTLDYLRIVSDPSQTANHYRKMLKDVRQEYIEFSKPPYAVDPLDEGLLEMQARLVLRGVRVDRSAHGFSELGDEDLLGLADGVGAAGENDRRDEDGDESDECFHGMRGITC